MGQQTITSTRRQRPLKPVEPQPEPQELREWARDQGFDVADRGRLPETIQAAWGEAQT
jgi:hypothetical protein